MAERRAIPVHLSLEEAADGMSVSVKTIRRWISQPACSRRAAVASGPSGSSSRTWRPHLGRFPQRGGDAAGRRVSR